MAQVRLASGKAFSTGLKYAKQVKGQFDAATKIWTLPDTPQVANMVAKAAIYGFVPVTTAAPAAAPAASTVRSTQPCPRCHTYCYGDCR